MQQELLYWYPAMGLSQQHWAQQVLLARCYSHDMVGSVLGVIHRELNIPVACSFVDVAVPGDEWSDDELAGLKNVFLERM